jgi:hypothetical protein
MVYEVAIQVLESEARMTPCVGNQTESLLAGLLRPKDASRDIRINSIRSTLTASRMRELDVTGAKRINMIICRELQRQEA